MSEIAFWSLLGQPINLTRYFTHAEALLCFTSGSLSGIVEVPFKQVMNFRKRVLHRDVRCAPSVESGVTSVSPASVLTDAGKT